MSCYLQLSKRRKSLRGKNDVYRLGRNRTVQAMKGLAEIYQSFFEFKKNPHPFVAFHGVDIETAFKILKCGEIADFRKRNEAIKAILETAKYYLERWLVGGRNTGKTYSVSYTTIRMMTDYPNNSGQCIRKNWKNVEQTLIGELDTMIKLATDGHPEYLCHIGSGSKSIAHKGKSRYEYTFRTRAEPSILSIYPEPDEASDRAVADNIKSPAGGLGLFYADEGSELRHITMRTLKDNLRRKVPIKAGLVTSNPFEAGSWPYRVAREQEDLMARGEEPRIYIVRSTPYENPFADQENIKAMEKDYENDPIQRAMLLEGRDVIIPDGIPVFKKEFHGGIHVSDDIKVSRYLPITVGIDWGYHHPAAVFCQEDSMGRWIQTGELLGEDWDLKTFSQQIFEYLHKHYPYHAFDPNQGRSQRDVIFWCDPAGSFQSERGNTTIEEFQDMGIWPNFRMDSRKPEKRVEVIRKLLTTMTDRKPRLRVHKRCEFTIQGFYGGWYYRVGRTGHIAEVPDKTGILHNILDAMGYLFWGEVGPMVGDRRNLTSQGTSKANGPTRKVFDQ